MSLCISLIVLLAAVLHASWNALLRAGSDRLWSMTVMCVAIAIVCAVVAPFVSAPARASWGYALLSALLHVGYNLFLVRTYPERGSRPDLPDLARIIAGPRVDRSGPVRWRTP